MSSRCARSTRRPRRSLRLRSDRQVQAAPAVPTGNRRIRPPRLGEPQALLLLRQLVEPVKLRIAWRTPRSSYGKTSGRPSENIKNICAVQTPIPLICVNAAMISSSSLRLIERRLTAPLSTRSARSEHVTNLLPGTTRPPVAVLRPSAESPRRRACRGGRLDQPALNRSGGMTGDLLGRIERTSIVKRSRSSLRPHGPTRSMTRRMCGHSRRRWRSARGEHAGIGLHNPPCTAGRRPALR